MFRVTWSIQNHCYMLIWCSRNMFYYRQSWKQLNCWKWDTFSPSEFFDESKVQKNSVSLKYKSFEMSLNVTFDQLNVFLKKSIDFFQEKKIPLTSDFWMVVYLITYLTLSIWTIMTVMLAFVIITTIPQTNIHNPIKSQWITFVIFCWISDSLKCVILWKSKVL